MPQTIEEPIVQEASELGLSPGIFPLTLWYDDKEWVRDRPVRTKHTLVTWIYVLDDLELHVLND